MSSKESVAMNIVINFNSSNLRASYWFHTKTYPKNVDSEKSVGGSAALTRKTNQLVNISTMARVSQVMQLLWVTIVIDLCMRSGLVPLSLNVNLIALQLHCWRCKLLSMGLLT